MSQGSSNFFVFLIVLVVLGAIVAVGANEFHHGFFRSSTFNFSGSQYKHFFSSDKREDNQSTAGEKPLARLGNFSETERPKNKKRTLSKAEKAALDSHKDSLARQDRAELDDLIDKVGK